MAGHKGYALALMVELFSGVLSGSAIGSDVGSMYKNLERKQDVGHFLRLFDIEAFMDLPILSSGSMKPSTALRQARNVPVWRKFSSPANVRRAPHA